MLERLKTWLDARADVRQKQQAAAAAAATTRDAAGDGDGDGVSRATPRREGLRPRVAGKAAATAAAGSDDRYVLVTVGTTKFEALIK
jgi:hypothetical protein